MMEKLKDADEPLGSTGPGGAEPGLLTIKFPPLPPRVFKASCLASLAEEEAEANSDLVEDDRTLQPGDENIQSTDVALEQGSYSDKSTMQRGPMTPDITAQLVTPLKKPTAHKKSESNVKVAVRARPLLKREQDLNAENVIDIDGNQIIVALEKNFCFDAIFNEDSSQEDIYNLLIEPSVNKVLNNYNACIFAYGQTGSGKTYTMGAKDSFYDAQSEHRGIIVRSLQQIFNTVQQRIGPSFSCIKVSFYEIVNEQVYDLINPSKQRVPLQVREVPNIGLFRISQLTEKEVMNLDDSLRLLEQGCHLRSTEATAKNSESSRSHAIFTVSICLTDNTGNSVTRKLSLVDLAGSESVKKSHATGERFAEAVGINKGLLALGSVVQALACKKSHVPYRDSVLTKALKESLKGTGYVSMIACISPTQADMTETVNTLRFANRVKSLGVNPIPAHLLNSCRASGVKKRQFAQLIPPTPAKFANNTIHSDTPSKRMRKDWNSRGHNLTIATPDKASQRKFEYKTPFSMRKELPRGFTSTAMKDFRTISSCNVSQNVEEESPSLPNLSGVSMIAPPGCTDDIDFSFAAKNLGPTFSQQDLTSVLSPYLRKHTEAIVSKVGEAMKQFTNQLMRDAVNNAPPTPLGRKGSARSRMTSSPKRMARLTDHEETEMSEDSSVGNNTILVFNGDRNEEASEITDKDKIIAGASTAGVLMNITNRPGSGYDSKRLSLTHKAAFIHAVIEDTEKSTGHNNEQTKSPEKSLRKENCQFSEATKSVHNSPLATFSPTMDEMEKALGINVNSPSLNPFAAPTNRTDRMRSRRSTRRTTMMEADIRKSLLLIPGKRESNRRRSARIAEQPFRQLNAEKENDNGVTLPEEKRSQFVHPLMIKENWKIDPEKQREHNETILSVLNTANLKMLGSLPAIGPKTAVILQGYRELNKGISSIEEIEHINGLSKGFYKRFLIQNQIRLDV